MDLIESLKAVAGPERLVQLSLRQRRRRTAACLWPKPCQLLRANEYACKRRYFVADLEAADDIVRNGAISD